MGVRAFLLQSYQRYREVIKLGAYTIAVFTAAAFLSFMFVRAWEIRGITRALIRLGLPLGITQLDIGGFLLGGYSSLIVLLFLDARKRAQGLILGIATLLALGVVYQRGFLLANATLVHFVWFLFGLFVSILIVAGPKFDEIEPNYNLLQNERGRLLTSKGTEPLTFPRAELYLYGVLVSLVVLAFIEAHTGYNNVLSVTQSRLTVTPLTELRLVGQGTLPFDLFFSALFVASLYMFLGYEANRDLFLLGPSDAGKTSLIHGLYDRAITEGRNARPGGDEIDEQRGEIFRSRQYPEKTRNETKEIGFTYRHGRLLPKDLNVSTVDYFGERLPIIKYGIDYHQKGHTEGWLESRIEEEIGIDLASSEETELEFEDEVGDTEDDGDETETIVDELVDQIVPQLLEADTLLFLIDLDELLQGDNRDLGINEYASIIQRLPSKRVIIVATKADLLADEYQNQTGLYPEDDYARFREHVTSVLEQDNEIRGLLGMVQDAPYPVYYQDDNGTPVFSAAGVTGPEAKLVLFGYSELLDRLGR